MCSPAVLRPHQGATMLRCDVTMLQCCSAVWCRAVQRRFSRSPRLIRTEHLCLRTLSFRRKRSGRGLGTPTCPRRPLSFSEPPPPSPSGGVSGVWPHSFCSAGEGHELVTSGPLRAERFPGPHPSLLPSVLGADYHWRLTVYLQGRERPGIHTALHSEEGKVDSRAADFVQLSAFLT